MCVVADVKFQENNDVHGAQTVHTLQVKCSDYRPITAELTGFVADMLEVAHTNFHEYSLNGSLIVAEKLQMSSSEVPLIIDQSQPTV